MVIQRMKYCLLSLCILLVNMNINDQIKENQFKIYCFGWEYTKTLNLSIYDYDDSWHVFLNSINLDSALIIINDSDIEEYQWKKQIIKLHEDGYDKLKKSKFRQLNNQQINK